MNDLEVRFPKVKSESDQHLDVMIKAAKWLEEKSFRTFCRPRVKLHCGRYYILDVYAFCDSTQTALLIEAKARRADWLHSRWKYRGYIQNRGGICKSSFAHYHLIASHAGVVQAGEVPKRWGFLEITDSGAVLKKAPDRVLHSSKTLLEGSVTPVMAPGALSIEEEIIRVNSIKTWGISRTTRYSDVKGTAGIKFAHWNGEGWVEGSKNAKLFLKSEAVALEVDLAQKYNTKDAVSESWVTSGWRPSAARDYVVADE